MNLIDAFSNVFQHKRYQKRDVRFWRVKHVNFIITCCVSVMNRRNLIIVMFANLSKEILNVGGITANIVSRCLHCKHLGVLWDVNTTFAAAKCAAKLVRHISRAVFAMTRMWKIMNFRDD